VKAEIHGTMTNKQTQQQQQQQQQQSSGRNHRPTTARTGAKDAGARHAGQGHRAASTDDGMNALAPALITKINANMQLLFHKHRQ